MLQLKNPTPLAAAISVLPNRDAVDTLYVVAKATFAIHPYLALAERRVPPTLIDEYRGDPADSSLKYASELHLGKPGTDVVLVGTAWAPGRRPTPSTAVAVSVAGRQKVVRVFGDRVWKRGGFTPPEPFESIPIVFERAFGGTHKSPGDGPILAEERNPVGVGFLGKRAAAEVIGHKLPNFEDPRRPLEQPGDLGEPACFGFVASGWLPRRSFAGTYDDIWQKKRAPYVPADFDARFFNAAAPELTFDHHLGGGELVEVLGASVHGPLRFALPPCQPRAEVKIAGACERPPFRLETVLIEPEDNRVCVSWRAQVSCDRKVLKVQEIAIDVEGLDLPVADVVDGQA